MNKSSELLKRNETIHSQKRFSRDTKLGQRSINRIRPRELESDPIHEKQEAKEYNEMVKKWFGLLNKPFVDMIAKIPLEEADVLDIGTGPGLIPCMLAQKKPGWRFWAVDSSEDMLSLGKTYAQNLGVADQVQFVKGNATNLPFPTGKFDVTISHFMLHHINHPKNLFNEAARVTHGGGKITIKDLRRQSQWKTSLLLWFSKHFLGYSQSQLQMYQESIDAGLTMEELKGALGQSKLRLATISKFRGLDFIITK